MNGNLIFPKPSCVQLLHNSVVTSLFGRIGSYHMFYFKMVREQFVFNTKLDFMLQP